MDGAPEDLEASILLDSDDARPGHPVDSEISQNAGRSATAHTPQSSGTHPPASHTYPVTVEDEEDVDEGGLPKQAWIEDYPGEAGATRTRTKPSFASNYKFYKKIDALPGAGAGWKVEVLDAVGDKLGEDGRPCTERVELWQRDVVDCVREIIGNPLFRDCIRYSPERQYTDEEGKTHQYGNMWTGNWWWDTKLPSGATVAPLILASDKTTLSRMSGDKSAWPVYLTVGNVDKAERRKPSSHATVLLGYLPVAKLECFSEKRRALEGYRLFHRCMKKLLEPLLEAGVDGVLMTCADGFIRRVYPILAAYIADHPEQCLVAACQENHCPKCPVAPNKRGDPAHLPLRDPGRVLDALNVRPGGHGKNSEFSGLRDVNPFWAGLPHANIFSALTPDLLHQLHKGVFKDHLVSWATKAMEGGADEVDRQFKAMPQHADLRHFKNGISLVSQWTGTEFRHMQKTFLGVVAGAADERVTLAVRAVLDFIYLAHFEVHTDASLDALNQAWLDFHEYKSVFIELEIREHFNFPKGHSMQHYEPSIRAVGTADGYSTEHPERLHIDFAKLAYSASNKQSSYVQQMTRWLERQDAVCHFQRYLTWARCTQPAGETTSSTSTSANPLPRTASTSGSRFTPGQTEAGGGSVDQPSESLPVDDDEDLDAWKDGYRIAKTPAFPSLTIERIETDFGATSFKATLTEYLKKLALGNSRRLALASTPLHPLTRISAYKQAKVRLPLVCQVSQTAPIDTIHATPQSHSSHTQPLRPYTPARMSTVVARDPSVPDHARRAFSPARPLAGLRIGRVHLIFNLPTVYDARSLGITGPLAYVEWFTPLHVRDSTTGMYVVSPSTRQRQRNCSIIPLSDILRTCHLIPVWGRQIKRRVVAGDPLDNLNGRFFINPYLRHHDFVLFRYLGSIT
ncbi:hypothetical protein C8Q77DRAFT_1067440 [Trametes polyzona]|nr:hypothetical protein C8Q77DRAFT_1067440 [Trametes polyzona]